MWIGFICPTDGEWEISKLQNMIGHNQVYWKMTDTAIQ